MLAQVQLQREETRAAKLSELMQQQATKLKAFKRRTVRGGAARQMLIVEPVQFLCSLEGIESAQVWRQKR